MKLQLGTLGVLTLFALAGCQQATDSKNSAFGETKALTVTATSPSTAKYFNLSTGQEVSGSDINSTKWDVGFSSSTQGVWTNSGATATAASSGGIGGVYYSGTTTFSDVVSYSPGSVKTDTSYWVKTANGYANGGYTYAVPVQSVLNPVTYLVYNGGSGATSSDPLVNNGADANYAGTAYYVSHSTQQGAPTYTMGNEVYVVRSGDGTKYFKFQIVDMTGDSTSRVRTIKYAVSN